ncbi:alpha/beta hydrolase [Aspergillus alliaceus]|uniref:alpha/beta hydrolase n=1 Tax=Petromyces alliaceus TaxID=209559 RepID=UPI0012A4480D|nr:Alpha/Beta hydrolase protein [Aspergillus alliaceus]KAB8231278.1 Alpha/Beta hydrolase protein [Aspergillus alliaceus]
MGIPEPNPPPPITTRDIIAVTTFLLIQAPWTILRTTLTHLTQIPNRPPLLKDLTRSLIRNAFKSLPLSIHNTSLNNYKPGSQTLSSPRYTHLKVHLFHPIHRPPFTAYWITRGLSTQLPPNKADIVIYHMRGSGYALGHPAAHLPALLFLAEILEKRGLKPAIFSLDYTLAQNAPFPKQIDEALAAYGYLLEEEGIDPERICLMGESAGGHLALAFLVALSLSHSGVGAKYPRPGSAVLLSPWIDLLLESPRTRDLEKRDYMSGSFLRESGERVLSSDTDMRLRGLFGNFRTSSTRRGGWEAILPTRIWVSAGADEIFADDIVGFVERARGEGVAVELEVQGGKCHCWQSGEALLCQRKVLGMAMDEDGVEGMMPGLVGVAGAVAGFRV